MTGKKRKADDDDQDDRMSSSPSPSMSTGALPHQNRTIKRARTNFAGRPLALPRLLETLSADEMRTLLQSICDRHPEIGPEVVANAPRPSVQSALEVLQRYEANLQASFPFGGRSSDYAYNRVRQPLSDLLDSLKDFVPHFLPPNETQAGTSLSFLDGATEVIHRLPNWDNYQNNRHKQEAYDEIARAWTLVVREAAKRAGGMQLLHGGWDQKLDKHNEASGGRMLEAVNELRGSLGWMGGDMGSGFSNAGPSNDAQSIRQQLLNGTYGLGLPLKVGPF